MPITTYNENYYDDFNVADTNGLTPSDKNYLRVLFKPGRSVQARELNQAQSILQSQLDRLGQGLFKPNSVIIGNPCNFQNNLVYLDVNFVPTETEKFLSIISDLNLVVLRQSQETTAKITKVEKLSEDTETANYRLFCHYNSGSTFGVTSAIIEAADVGDTSINLEITAVGNAIGAGIDNSVYYINGCMVAAHSQYETRIIEKSDNSSNLNFNGAVILDVSESKVSAVDDQTLFDNANGSPNYAGIGADRYKIDLKLKIASSEELLEPAAKNYVSILTIKDTNPIVRVNSIDNSGSNLEKILATRTFEESGDYTVRDFPIEILEAYGSDYRARYTDSNDETVLKIGINNVPNKFACTLSPSVAYVKGTRVELLGPNTIIGDKARVSWNTQYGSFKSVAMNANLGSYVEGTLISDLPNFDSTGAVYNIVAGSTDIGNCKIQSIEKVTDTIFRLYLHSISLDPGQKIDNATKIADTAFTFNLSAGKNKLKDSKVNSSIFTFPHTAVRDVKHLRVTEKIKSMPVYVTEQNRNATFPISGKVLDKSPGSLIVLAKTDTESKYLKYSSNPTIADEYTIVSSADDTLSLTIGGTDVYAITVIISATSDITSSRGTKKLTTETINVTSAPVNVGSVFELDNVFHLMTINDTAWEIVEDGQHPGEYLKAKIRSKVAIGETNQKSVNITHWKFEGDGNYYTVNSYVNATNGSVRLEEIPLYNNQRLCDCLDTRQRFGLPDRLALDAYSAITSEIDFFLPRRDVVCVNTNTEFFIEKGVPDTEPNFPKNGVNSLVLYNLFVPAYTFNTNDILIARVDNRRFTMRDIGNIEKRIGTLEYYTTLSLLEKSANDKSVFEDDGTEKFKNGFVTDGFRNHSVGNINSKDYLCSIDKERGRLFPYHNGYSVPFKLDNGSAVFSTHKNLMLNHSEVLYLEQGLATQFISLQPHEVISSQGSLELNPEVDTWSDRKTNPPRNIELFPGLDDTLAALGAESGLTGTDWNAWTNVGVTSVGRGRRRQNVTNQVSTGVQTTMVNEDINTSLGRFVSDVSIKPYMRSRVIRFRCEALKANTRYFVFFDERNITNYVTVFNGTENILNQNISIDDGLDEQTLIRKYISNNGTLGNVDGNIDLKSNADGILQGYIIVPNNDALKFSSGEKIIKITNSPRNLQDESTSEADARFISNGLGITTDETVISTSLPRIVRTPVSRTRQVRRRRDPIAQTFTVEDETGIFLSSVEAYFAGKPSAINSPGVTAYLVTVINGYPSSTVIPGSEVYLGYDSIITSDDSSLPTKFKFTSPVYLNPQTEYALVLFSESNEYTAYIAEMGGTKRDLLTDQIISNQAALGVFFTSSNKSTWSAAQNRDLKFKLHRASFETVNGVNVGLTPFVGTGLQGIEIPNDTANSGWATNTTTVTVEAPSVVTTNSNGDLVPIPVVGGVSASATATVDPNTGKIIAFNILRSGFGYVSAPTVTISRSNPAVSGSPIITTTVKGILQTTKVAAVNLNQKNINFIGKTTITNQLDLGGTMYPIGGDSPLEDVLNKNYTIDTNNATNTKLKITLSSNDNRLSPVIDLHSLSLETRDYTIASLNKPESETSKYFTKEITLTNPADQLDVYLDVNLPTSTSAIQVYGQFKDINGELIGDGSDTAATATITVNGNLVAENTITINGTVYTVAGAAGHRNIVIPSGQSAINFAAAIRDAINFSSAADQFVTASANGAIVTLTAKVKGVLGNNITLNKTEIGSAANIILSSNKLRGAVDANFWLPILPFAPRTIPINSNRNLFSEVRFNVNPSVDFASFIVKIVFRGENYIDVASVKDLRAIASM